MNTYTTMLSEQRTEVPVAQLRSGIRVANLMSTHTYIFEDGTRLQGNSDFIKELLIIERIEKEYTYQNRIDIIYIPVVKPALIKLVQKLDADENIDVILVSGIVMKALYKTAPYLCGKLRLGYAVNKDMNGNAIYSISKFISKPY